MSLTSCGRMRTGGIEVADAEEGAGVDDEVGQGVEAMDGVGGADLGALDAEGGGLAVDALGRGPLVVDGEVGVGVAVEGGAHQPAGFDVDAAATAVVGAEVVVVAGLAGRGRE